MEQLDQGHIDLLSQVAMQLAARVRDDDPQANGLWLAEVLPDPADWWRLAFVLAAAVPDRLTWVDLTAWARGEQKAVEPAVDLPQSTGPACGTPRGARRHWRRGESACSACKAAENRRNAIRRQSARSNRQEKAA